MIFPVYQSDSVPLSTDDHLLLYESNPGCSVLVHNLINLVPGILIRSSGLALMINVLGFPNPYADVSLFDEAYMFTKGPVVRRVPCFV